MLVTETSGEVPSGEQLGILGVRIVDSGGELVGTIRQAFRPAIHSRIPGRSVPFSVVGTPSAADEIDIPGVQEGILAGVLSHPEGRRLFPDLDGFEDEA